MNNNSSSVIGALTNGPIQAPAEVNGGGFAAPTSLSAVGDDSLRSPEIVMHDLAIITVSTNEAQWIRPCLRTVFSHIGDVSTDVVVVRQRIDGRDGRARWRGVPGRARRVVTEPRVLAREQSGADDL